MEVRGGGLEALGGEVLLWQALCREHQPCQHQVDLNIGNIENVTYVNIRNIKNINYVNIRTLQLILTKICLVLGVSNNIFLIIILNTIILIIIFIIIVTS